MWSQNVQVADAYGTFATYNNEIISEKNSNQVLKNRKIGLKAEQTLSGQYSIRRSSVH